MRTPLVKLARIKFVPWPSKPLPIPVENAAKAFKYVILESGTMKLIVSVAKFNIVGVI